MYDAWRSNTSSADHLLNPLLWAGQRPPRCTVLIEKQQARLRQRTFSLRCLDTLNAKRHNWQSRKTGFFAPFAFVNAFTHRLNHPLLLHIIHAPSCALGNKAKGRSSTLNICTLVRSESGRAATRHSNCNTALEEMGCACFISKVSLLAAASVALSYALLLRECGVEGATTCLFSLQLYSLISSG